MNSQRLNYINSSSQQNSKINKTNSGNVLMNINLQN